MERTRSKRRAAAADAPAAAPEAQRPKLNDIHQKQEKKTERPVVSHDQWVEARKALLQKEKQLLRHVDEVTRARRELPWEKVEKDYEFEGADGPVKLSALFSEGKNDLIVYHMMFDKDDATACSVCSLWTDGFNGYYPHIRSVASLVVIAKAPKEKLATLRASKHWDMPLLSSANNTFNADLGVQAPEGHKEESSFYNYGSGWVFPAGQFPGLSVFHCGQDGTIYHTYSTYARGLDPFNALHSLLDALPYGRDGFMPKHKEEYAK